MNSDNYLRAKNKMNKCMKILSNNLYLNKKEFRFG